MRSAWLGMMLIGLGVNAQSAGRIADVQIIDRDTGSVLPMYRCRGEYWVAGTPGTRYSIMLHNHRGERILAVTAVDGINVISGETGGFGQSGYVFSPGESYEIAGWRKSDAQIAAFNFTSAEDSYAGRTRRPANVGVIGVALFLERPAQAPEYQSSDRASPPFTGGLANRASAASKLGTGHGARETSYVQSTSFDRWSSTPNEVIKIRYDSFENLVAMGVVPAHPAWQPGPNPFPESMLPHYVPDPPGG